MLRSIKFFLFTALMGLTLTSCYRMPGEDDYSLIPNINNPDITRAKESAEPAMKY
jgi:hypothetical protein